MKKLQIIILGVALASLMSSSKLAGSKGLVVVGIHHGGIQEVTEYRHPIGNTLAQSQTRIPPRPFH